MPDRINRQIFLQARPVGPIRETDFGYRESPVPPLQDGQILLRNIYLSLDPAMRGWMGEKGSYREPINLGDTMHGGTIAEIIESKNPDFPVGQRVIGMQRWEDFSIAGPKGMPNLIPPGFPIPLVAFLSTLGATGLTAYFGLLEIGKPKEGETVVVSTAAGAVGSVVGQIAKIKGCRTVGLTGSDEKCKYIVEHLGYDVAINYKTQNVAKALREACPNGIDVYFDNVGGEILNTVLGQLALNARIAICGAISQYNNTEATPGPSNYINLLIKRSRMEGFLVLDYFPRYMEGVMQLAQWMMEEKLTHKEHIVEGLEKAPTYINYLFEGKNDGKLVVKIADE